MNIEIPFYHRGSIVYTPHDLLIYAVMSMVKASELAMFRRRVEFYRQF